jgi:GT2 family glycosyltransferase
MISLCVPVYRAREAPNVAGIGTALAVALDGRDGELVVVLNGIDRERAGVSAGAQVVQLAVNRGVSPAWNAAAKAARGEVLAFCNDDVELGAGALARLAEALERLPDAGVVGPMGSRWDIARGRHLSWADPNGDPPLDAEPGSSRAQAPARCEVVSGFLFACRREVYEQVGGFDDLYAPASWEEVDFCTAVRAAGHSCYAIPGVDCRHEWGVSRRQPPWARARWDGRSETWRSIHRRNRRRFLQKWSESPIAQSPVSDAACA